MKRQSASRDWTRRYPPLTVVVGALALAIFTLPSALNLPQANPGQTLEYAPVPGNGTQANAGGNFAGLGSGSGSAAGDAGVAPLLPPDQLAQSLATALHPSQYQCVGNPPRQTEDPLSPPCVASYSGDNGGATWVGVTAKEIRVVFRFVELKGQCRTPVGASNNCPTGGNGIFDMDVPADYNQYFLWTDLHNWEVYFNRHYQTYNRKVHFYVDNFGDTQQYASSGYSPSDATSEAATAFAKVTPFANWDTTTLFTDSYTQYFAQHRALSFGSLLQSLASQYPGQYWSYLPPLEYVAQQYASFVCTRVYKPGKVTFSGDSNLGSPRVYGVLETDDPQNVETQQVQKAAIADIHQMCGLTPRDTKTFHYSGAYNTTGPKSGWGAANMATFSSEGITTILWPGGEESEDMTAASKLNYHPEWVLLGDTLLDGNLMSAQASDEIGHAWVTTPLTRLNADGQPVEQACLDALLEVNPQISQQGGDIAFACGGPYSTTLYDDIRQIFTGIQLAGPRLTPQSMNQGFHAIPPKPSTSPSQPSCYYLPGDYTCVKDGVAEWFDTTTPVASSSSSGCWRMWRGGQRFLPGQWPEGDVNDKTPADVCNGSAGGLQNSVRPPGG